MESKEVIEQWNKAALQYAEEQRTAPNNLTNWQIIKDIIGNIDGKNILDAGCGDGFFSNELKSMGANVKACDGSLEFINIAKSNYSDIDFKVCDLTEKLPYENSEFDIVVSSLTLMDIDYLDKFFEESNRVLKNNGKLIFTIVHPCFFQAEWEKDEQGNRLYKKVENYWKLDKEVLHYWGETTHYHRPISWYSKKLKDAEFAIEEIKENPDNVENLEYIKPHQRRLPLFICFKAVKLQDKR